MITTHRRYSLLAALILALVTLSLGLSGCRDGVEMSEMDQALAPARALPLDERIPALRAFRVEQPELASYGSYEMGNTYYELAAATDSVPGVDSLTGTNALLDSALVAFQTAIAADSTFVEAWVNMGLIWDDISDGRTPQARRATEEAKNAYLAAVALRPTDEKARCNLGSLFFRRHQYAEAVEQFQAVLDHDPESSLAHYNLAIMFAESRMYREASTEWELASKYDPDGDIGERSRDNLKVIEELMNSEIPEDLKGGH